MHPVSLRVGSGEDLPDIDDVDGEWLQECNEFMMHLDHRDAILLDRFSTYDYEDFFMEGNELAQEDQGLKYLDLCMFGSDEDKISGLMALALACSSLRDKKPSSKKPSAEFVKFVRDQFSAKTEVSLAFCDLMWEISLNIPKPSGDGDGDLLHYLRFDLNELQHSIRLKLEQLEGATNGGITPLLESMAPASELRAKHKECVVVLLEDTHNSGYYKTYTRYAFQHVDLMKSHKNDMFHTEVFDEPTQAAFDADMVAFKKTSSYAARFAIFAKYIYYYKSSEFMPRVINAAVERLDSIFKRLPPLKKPLVVYRKVADIKLMKKHQLIGFTPTSLRTTKPWSREKCCLMRLHIPAGNRVFPAFGITDPNNHMKIVLPHMSQITEMKKSEKNPNPALLYVRDQNWPREAHSEKGKPMWVYDFRVAKTPKK